MFKSLLTDLGKFFLAIIIWLIAEALWLAICHGVAYTITYLMYPHINPGIFLFGVVIAFVIGFVWITAKVLENFDG